MDTIAGRVERKSEWNMGLLALFSLVIPRVIHCLGVLKSSGVAVEGGLEI